MVAGMRDWVRAIPGTFGGVAKLFDPAASAASMHPSANDVTLPMAVPLSLPHRRLRAGRLLLEFYRVYVVRREILPPGA